MSQTTYHLHSGHIVRVYPDGEVWLDTSDRIGTALRLGADHEDAVALLQAVLDRLEVEEAKRPSVALRAAAWVDWVSRVTAGVVLGAAVLWLAAMIERWLRSVA
jgi:hypothetical protein